MKIESKKTAFDYVLMVLFCGMIVMTVYPFLNVLAISLNDPMDTMRNVNIEGMPLALQEAAKIDGANDFTIWLKVILPLCKPVLATVALFIAVGQWNSFMDTYLYARELPTLQYVLYEIMESAQIKVDPHAAALGQLKNTVSPMSVRMAVTVVATVPILVVYPFLQKYFVGGMTLGAVKD